MTALLRLRKQKEQAAQKEAMLAHQQLNKVKEALDLLQSECDFLADELRKKQKTTRSIHDFRNYYLYLQELRRKIESQQDEMLKAQNLLEIKREKVAEAMQNKKILENIKDKQYAEWQEQFEKLEAKLIDELATIKFIRNKEGLRS